MRQAVVNLGSDLLKDRGLRLEVFRDAGVRDVELLSCEGPRGVVRLRVEEPLDAQRLDAMDAVQWWEKASSDESEHVYLVEAGDGAESGATPTENDGFPRCERVRVTDRGLTVTWAGPRDQLHEELATLDAAGNDVTLEKLRGYRAREEPLDALTDRQREVLEAAFERGYLDVPRGSSVQAVAAEFELDDSTVAEHLQRAERNLLGALLDTSR